MSIKNFNGQRDDEEAIFIIHKHWSLLFRAMFWFFASLIALFIIFRIFLASWVSALFFFIWLLTFGTYLFYEWFNWYRDIFILTDQRVIEIEQVSFFRKKVTEAPLENIQDVSWEITGFWGTILRYGSISIQTAGAQEKVNFDFISRPARVSDQINDVRNFILQSKPKPSNLSAEELIEYITKQKQAAEAEVEDEEQEEEENSK